MGTIRNPVLWEDVLNGLIWHSKGHGYCICDTNDLSNPVFGTPLFPGVPAVVQSQEVRRQKLAFTFGVWLGKKKAYKKKEAARGYEVGPLDTSCSAPHVQEFPCTVS